MARRGTLSYSDTLDATRQYGFVLAISAKDHTIAFGVDQPSRFLLLLERNHESKLNRSTGKHISIEMMYATIKRLGSKKEIQEFERKYLVQEEPEYFKRILVRRLDSPEFNAKAGSEIWSEENKRYSLIARRTVDHAKEHADVIRSQMYALLDDRSVINIGYAVRGGHQLKDAQNMFNVTFSAGMYNRMLVENAVDRVMDNPWIPDVYKYALDDLTELAEENRKTLCMFLNQDNTALAVISPEDWEKYSNIKDVVHEVMFPAYIAEAMNDVMHTSDFHISTNVHLPFAHDDSTPVVDVYITADIDDVATMLDNLSHYHSREPEEIKMDFWLEDSEEAEQTANLGW